MRTHNATPARNDGTRLTTPLMVVLLMVVGPALLVAMTRVASAPERLLLGLGAGVAIAAAGFYLYRLGQPA